MIYILVARLTDKPKFLFLADGIGALVTAFLTGVILIQFTHFIGLTQTVLYSLSAIAFIFACYSFSCCYFLQKVQALHLRCIGYANLLYCVVTILFLFYNRYSVQPLGYVYFFLEIIIIFFLSYLELSVAKQLQTIGN